MTTLTWNTNNAVFYKQPNIVSIGNGGYAITWFCTNNNLTLVSIDDGGYASITCSHDTSNLTLVSIGYGGYKKLGLVQTTEHLYV